LSRSKQQRISRPEKEEEEEEEQRRRRRRTEEQGRLGAYQLRRSSGSVDVAVA